MRCRLSPPSLLVVAALCATACFGHEISNTVTPVGVCTATVPIAVAVAVRDSVSGRALADSASGTVRLGTVADTLLHEDSITLYGGRQIGTYDVEILRPGYRPWSRLGVAANQTGMCGNVVTVALIAQLQPLP
jgi:hypothetical protein